MPDRFAPAKLEEVELGEVIGKSAPSSSNEGDFRKRGFERATSLASYPELDQPFEQYKQLDILTQNERTWITRLVIMSIFDLGVSSMVIALAFATAWYDSGLSLYCIGIQACAHLISSLVCLLRFWKESRFGKYGSKDGRSQEDNHDDEDAALLTERKRDFKREQVLSVAIGVILLLSAAVMAFKAARKFKFWEVWHQHQQDVRDSTDKSIQTVCEVIAWKSGGIYTLQAAIRWFSKQDTGEHKFVNHLFWVSFTSMMFCYVLGLSASYQKEWSWKAEPIAAATLAIGSCVEGMRILYVYFDDIDDLMTRHTRP